MQPTTHELSADAANEKEQEEEEGIGIYKQKVFFFNDSILEGFCFVCLILSFFV